LIILKRNCRIPVTEVGTKCDTTLAIKPINYYTTLYIAKKRAAKMAALIA